MQSARLARELLMPRGN